MKALRPDMTLAEEAADWLTRLAEPADLRAREEFVIWLKRSPRHIEEFFLVSATHRLMSGIDPERQLDPRALAASASGVLPFPVERPHSDHGAAKEATPRRVWRLVAGVAACLAVSVALLFAFDGLNPTYTTGIGEQRALRLDDGSLLHLNTRSKVEIDFSERSRDVRLLEGEALFTVQRDAQRPFRVLTHGVVVQAIGTQFNVYEHGDGVRISVIEGRVRILDDRSPPASLAAGEEASVRSGGEIAKRAIADATVAVAWRQRRIAFHGATLDEVVEQFNRYNQLQIRIVGGVPARRISAVFNADEPEALLQFLEHEPHVRMERRGDVAVISTKP